MNAKTRPWYDKETRLYRTWAQYLGLIAAVRGVLEEALEKSLQYEGTRTRLMYEKVYRWAFEEVGVAAARNATWCCTSASVGVVLFAECVRTDQGLGLTTVTQRER